MYAKARKFVKRGAKQLRKRYTAKPGGRKATGGVRVGKMAKDILYLKSVLNPEKKRFETQDADIILGQVNGINDGYLFRDMTPAPPQGTGYADRTGASIKLHSSMYHFQFIQQANARCRIRGVIEIYEVLGDPQPGFTFPTERFLANPFTGVRDMNCHTNPDNFMKGRCIARRNFSVQTDQLGGESLTTDVKIPMKYNKGQGKHIRWDKNTSTLANGQLLLIIRVDRGNCNPVTVATNPVPDIGVSTGIVCSFNRTDYFYDN